MPKAVVFNHKYSKKAHCGQVLVFANSKEKSKGEKDITVVNVRIMYARRQANGN